MTTSRKQTEKELLQAFKGLLKEQTYSSQEQLAKALEERGFKNMSQAKVSRLLAKIGAIKTRNTANQIIYILPDELVVPKSREPIQSIITSVVHNGMQIILKTGIGGAPIISRMLDSMGEASGILGTVAGDDTIFIAPTDIEKIEEITQSIILWFGVGSFK